EQFNKQRGASGPWTDVFALALILVELVSGKKALEGDDPTELYIASADPTMRPTARARGASVPDAVEQVLLKAVSVAPKDRYADGGAFGAALREAAPLARRVRASAPSFPGSPLKKPPPVAPTLLDTFEGRGDTEVPAVPKTVQQGLLATMP